MDPTLVRLALAARRPALLPPGARVPRIESSAPAARDPARLRALCALCAIPDDGRMPPTWPQVLATPLLLRVLADDAFPLRPMGLVHVAQRIEIARAVPGDAALALDCTVDGHREVEAGQAIDVEVVARLDGEPVWRGTSTLLARRPRAQATGAGPRGSAADTGAPAVGPAPPADREASLRAEVDTGRRYARVSGDWNPIHLWAASARPFGFRGAIAHGLWTLARALAAIDGDGDGDGVRDRDRERHRERDADRDARRRIDARFGAPLPLPSAPRVRWSRGPRDLSFEVRPEDGGRPHVAGTIATCVPVPRGGRAEVGPGGETGGPG